MTQKTNQFNLTTIRYTEKDIEQFVQAADSEVLAFNVSDKYGDSGITGLSILKYNDRTSTAEIDTFLMSCRVIGRNIENAFLDYLMRHLSTKNVQKLMCRYRKTNKNEQVKNFYEKSGATVLRKTETAIDYFFEIKNYPFNNLNYINIGNRNSN